MADLINVWGVQTSVKELSIAPSFLFVGKKMHIYLCREISKFLLLHLLFLVSALHIFLHQMTESSSLKKTFLTLRIFYQLLKNEVLPLDLRFLIVSLHVLRTLGFS